MRAPQRTERTQKGKMKNRYKTRMSCTRMCTKAGNLIHENNKEKVRTNQRETWHEWKLPTPYPMEYMRSLGTNKLPTIGRTRLTNLLNLEF